METKHKTFQDELIDLLKKHVHFGEPSKFNVITLAQFMLNALFNFKAYAGDAIIKESEAPTLKSFDLAVKNKEILYVY